MLGRSKLATRRRAEDWKDSCCTMSSCTCPGNGTEHSKRRWPVCLCASHHRSGLSDACHGVNSVAATRR